MPKGKTTTSPKTLIVEDNALLAAELHEVLTDAGLAPFEPCSNYRDAMSLLAQDFPEYCVLDLDLSGNRAWHEPLGTEGRRLLSVLANHGSRTVIYSGLRVPVHDLLALDTDVEVVSKSDPVEAVVAALRRRADDTASL
ncbi:response regulator [Allosediminivita pacifica]|uniref:Response regulator receiver domain-containing protein n=1 Tax=Allosediminivita pacifica TaxID=1267769 RepID=A0A2T6AUH2_9RHOB|nr:response regulator [Allosediminivita pacifica]PTX47457.1 response regulator receiver domain-containing protein [Allosediminivita pacifica]GGB14344.1 hypothetical protein GCM10011324_25670 [Allosediminivita pacifica]